MRLLPKPRLSASQDEALVPSSRLNLRIRQATRGLSSHSVSGRARPIRASSSRRLGMTDLSLRQVTAPAWVHVALSCHGAVEQSATPAGLPCGPPPQAGLPKGRMHTVNLGGMSKRSRARSRPRAQRSPQCGLKGSGSSRQ